MPPKKLSRMIGSPQPRRGSSIRANTGPARPSAQSTPPTRSTRARFAPVGCPARDRVGDEPGRVTRANGTLTRNTQRQDACSTSQPPASGPITKAMPVHAVHAPIAAPRASPVNVVAITARPRGGEDRAGRRPAGRARGSGSCRSRAPLRRGIDATPKEAMPIREDPAGAEEVAERPAHEEQRGRASGE